MKKLWILFLFIFLVSCQKQTYKVILPEHVTVSDETINLDKVPRGKELTLTINLPFHHELVSITVNGTEKIDSLEGINLKVRITSETNIQVTFHPLEESLSFENNEQSFTFDLDTFRLEHIRLAYDSKDGRGNIPLKKEYLSEEDFLKLFTTGDYFITINYKGLTLETLIKMRSVFTQPKLPEVTVYSLKEVLDSVTTYTFYTIGSYVSYTISFNPNMNLKPVVSYTDGIFGSNYKDSIFTAIHTFGELRSGSNQIFKVEFNGLVDFQYVNQMCEFLTLTTELETISDVRYYQR